MVEKFVVIYKFIFCILCYICSYVGFSVDEILVIFMMINIGSGLKNKVK